VERVTAYGAYCGVLKEAIHALKYDGVRGVASPLARLAAAGHGAPPSGAAVVAVPSHSSRFRQRWLDHAGLLAEAVAAAMAVEAMPGVVVRCKPTRPQVGLGLDERLRNLDEAFVASGQVCGKSVVLVDDVLTTGSTACAAARSLRQAGARAVSVCVVARADELA
jgi:predicted amidophosphoribosyltransferase